MEYAVMYLVITNKQCCGSDILFCI